VGSATREVRSAGIAQSPRSRQARSTAGRKRTSQGGEPLGSRPRR
jgi:hypothetical protein